MVTNEFISNLYNKRLNRWMHKLMDAYERFRICYKLINTCGILERADQGEEDKVQVPVPPPQVTKFVKWHFHCMNLGRKLYRKAVAKQGSL